MWQTLALGLVFFPAFFAASIRSLRWLVPAWSLKDRILLSGRLVSSIQATMATLSGLVVIFSCRDVVNDRSIADRDNRKLFLPLPPSPSFSLQHLRGERGDFFVGCIFTAELSTPFVSLGKTLMQLKMQDSLLHKINGILILVTFFLCRILLFPYMYWAYGQQMNIPIYKVPFHIPLHCNVANAFLIAPQMYWFALICRKAMRLYSNSPAPDRTR
ncbi:protein FAM57A [Pseudonaja textilis]|uniref:protein FAM57A n=1 Tax=Pseudonaja textilis TaxID=8673 RepID=UPI000EA927B5|nr:protein FAM57A [Pseudonaja textilis]